MKFKTKFNKEDHVWFMKNNKPTEAIISAIEIFYVGTSQDKIKYSGRDARNPVTWIDHTNLFEDCIYGSKKELLDSL